MEYQSVELKNAPLVASYGIPERVNVDVDQVKNHIKQFFISKQGLELTQKLEKGYIFGSGKVSGLDTTKDYIKLLKEEIINSIPSTDPRRNTLNRLFDNLNNTLECIASLDVNVVSVELNAVILGYILRNLIKI